MQPERAGSLGAAGSLGSAGRLGAAGVSVWVAKRSLGRWLLLAVACVLLVACQRPYRVGDHVLVEWGAEKLLYPAYIIELKGKARYRVTFEGYPARWDEDINLPRIKGLAPDSPVHPPPPRHVRLSTGMSEKKPDEIMSRYQTGQSLKVRWRNSAYRAVVIEVVSTDEIKVHYDGHESAWDEVIPIERVVTH